MESIHKHMNKTIFMLIATIYIVFLLIFLIINSRNIYEHTKSELENSNYYNQNIIKEHIIQVRYYNNHINNLLMRHVGINNEDFYEPVLKDSEKQLLEVLFKDNRYFSNFLIINNQAAFEFALEDISIDDLNLNLLNNIKHHNQLILSNQLLPNHLTILY